MMPEQKIAWRGNGVQVAPIGNKIAVGKANSVRGLWTHAEWKAFVNEVKAGDHDLSAGDASRVAANGGGHK